MNTSEAIKTLVELGKKGVTIPSQEKIMELREHILSLKEENISLRAENQTLKLQLEAERDFGFDGDVYWKEGDDKPFCQPCLDSDKNRVRLQVHRGKSGGWVCFVCTKYFTPRRSGDSSTISFSV